VSSKAQLGAPFYFLPGVLRVTMPFTQSDRGGGGGGGINVAQLPSWNIPGSLNRFEKISFSGTCESAAYLRGKHAQCHAH